MPWFSSALRVVAKAWGAISARVPPVQPRPEPTGPLDRGWVSSPRSVGADPIHELHSENLSMKAPGNILTPTHALSEAEMMSGHGNPKEPKPKSTLRSAKTRSLGPSNFLRALFVSPLQWTAAQLEGTAISGLTAAICRFFVSARVHAGVSVGSPPRFGKGTTRTASTSIERTLFSTPTPRKKVARRLPPTPPTRYALDSLASSLPRRPTAGPECATTGTGLSCPAAPASTDRRVDDCAPTDGSGRDCAALLAAPTAVKRTTRWAPPSLLGCDTGPLPTGSLSLKPASSLDTKPVPLGPLRTAGTDQPSTKAVSSGPPAATTYISKPLNPHAPIFKPQNPPVSPPLSRRAKARRLALARKRRAVFSLAFAKPFPHLAQPPEPPTPPLLTQPPLFAPLSPQPPPVALQPMYPEPLPQPPAPWVRPQKLLPPRMRAAALGFLPLSLGADGLLVHRPFRPVPVAPQHTRELEQLYTPPAYGNRGGGMQYTTVGTAGIW